MADEVRGAGNDGVPTAHRGITVTQRWIYGAVAALLIAIGMALAFTTRPWWLAALLALLGLGQLFFGAIRPVLFDERRWWGRRLS